MGAVSISQISILEKSIHWKKHPSMQGYWLAKVDNEIVYLRMNNFPHEFLFTVITKESIREIDELPDNWNAEE